MTTPSSTAVAISHCQKLAFEVARTKLTLFVVNGSLFTLDMFLLQRILAFLPVFFNNVYGLSSPEQQNSGLFILHFEKFYKPFRSKFIEDLVSRNRFDAAMSNPNGLLSQNYVTILTRAAH